MKFWTRILGFAFIVATSLATSACEGPSGVGLGTGYPGPHWGGGASGPGVWVGGPAF